MTDTTEPTIATPPKARVAAGIYNRMKHERDEAERAWRALCAKCAAASARMQSLDHALSTMEPAPVMERKKRT